MYFPLFTLIVSLTQGLAQFLGGRSAAYIGYGAKSGRHHYYVCGTAYSKGKDTCPSQHLPKEKLEKYVVDKIKGYILTDENLKDLVRLINEELEGSLGKYKERIQAIERETVQWEGRLERLYDFVETRSIEPVRMAKRIVEIQDKVNEMRKARFEVEQDIRRRRLEPLDTDVVVKYVNDLKKILESSDIFERRAFLRTFIDSLEVDDGEITFNYGLPPDGIKQETVPVLGIVPPGPPEGIRTIEQIQVSQEVTEKIESCIWKEQLSICTLLGRLVQ